MSISITGLALHLALFAPSQTELDRNISGAVYPRMSGHQILTAGVLQATITASASTSLEVHRVPALSNTTLINSLPQQAGATVRLVSQGAQPAFVLDSDSAFFFGLPDVSRARFLRFNERGELLDDFLYSPRYATFAASADGSFKITGNTLQALPEQFAPVDLSWCAFGGCSIAAAASMQATTAGAWLITRRNCTLVRVDRHGALLESFPLPIPPAECAELRIARDQNHALRISTRSASTNVYGLSLSDARLPVRLSSALVMPRETLLEPLASGDWLAKAAGVGGTQLLRRVRANPLIAGKAQPPVTGWEIELHIEPHHQVATSAYDSIAVYSAEAGFHIGPGGNVVHRFAGASRAAFDPAGNLAVMPAPPLGTPDLTPQYLHWFSPNGQQLRSDALGPTIAPLRSAHGRYSTDGSVLMQFDVASGQVAFENVRQYDTHGGRIWTHRATGIVMETAPMRSDYWYELQPRPAGDYQMLVRHLSTSANPAPGLGQSVIGDRVSLIELLCKTCWFETAVEFENGLLLPERLGLGNGGTFWLFQGARLQTLSVENFQGIIATPQQPQGDILRFVSAPLPGQPRTVFGLNRFGDVAARYQVDNADAVLEPSGGMYRIQNDEPALKLNSDGSVDKNWRLCGSKLLAFTAEGHWALSTVASQHVLCFSKSGQVLRAQIPELYDGELAFGSIENVLKMNNFLFRATPTAIQSRQLIAAPVAVSDLRYSVLELMSGSVGSAAANGMTTSNSLLSYPMPHWNSLETIIFSADFE